MTMVISSTDALSKKNARQLYTTEHRHVANIPSDNRLVRRVDGLILYIPVSSCFLYNEVS